MKNLHPNENVSAAGWCCLMIMILIGCAADLRAQVPVRPSATPVKQVPVRPIATPVKQTQDASVIVPGKGAGKIILGASASEIEAILGKPEKLVDDTDFDGTLEYNYYSKGIRLIFDSKSKIATSVLFTGETAGSSFAGYKIYKGQTDRGIKWGAASAEITQIYGKPVKELFKYTPGAPPQHQWLRYRSVEFGFREGKLIYISNDNLFGK